MSARLIISATAPFAMAFGIANFGASWSLTILAVSAALSVTMLKGLKLLR
jgi:hypothetical protein